MFQMQVNFFFRELEIALVYVFDLFHLWRQAPSNSEHRGRIPNRGRISNRLFSNIRVYRYFLSLKVSDCLKVVNTTPLR